MSNPQKENGYTAIANELMDEYCKLNLSPTEWKVLHYVMRKTYGYNKIWDEIALSQFQRGCFIDRTQVCRTLKQLVAKQLLVRSKNGYSINKNYDGWVVAKQPVAKQPVAKQSIGVVAKQPHTITNITKTKESVRFEEFYKIYPRKQSRQDAIKAWGKLTERERSLAIQALPNHCASDGWKEKKYIPLPASWLNAKRWEDEIEKPLSQALKGPIIF